MIASRNAEKFTLGAKVENTAALTVEQNARQRPIAGHWACAVGGQRLGGWAVGS
jgi:hypothetical protein